MFNIKKPKIDLLLTYKPGRSKWEKWCKIFLKCATLVMCGRFGVMPYPHPIAVVGKFQIILKLELQCQIQGRAQGARPPLFFDQNEAQRAENFFLETGPPPLI